MNCKTDRSLSKASSGSARLVMSAVPIFLIVTLTAFGCGNEEETVTGTDTGNENRKEVNVPSGSITWVQTGVSVSVGDALQITATGLINVGISNVSSGPTGSGQASGDGYPLPDAPRYSLIGAIDDVTFDPVDYPDRTTYFPIGDEAAVVCSHGGILYLAVNDDSPWDNGLAYQATITHMANITDYEVPGYCNVWTDTGIDIVEGDTVEISGSGQIFLGNPSSESSGPEGWDPPTGNTGFPMPDAPRYCLIGAIGDTSKDPDEYPLTSTYFAVGKKTTFTAEQDGRLYLSCNDDSPWDDIGSFRAVITIGPSD